MLNSTSKSVKSKGILFLASHQVRKSFSSLAKVMLFQKTFTKELIFVASSLALLAEKMTSVDLENWFVVSEKSGQVTTMFCPGIRIGHFQVALSLIMEARLSAKFLL